MQNGFFLSLFNDLSLPSHYRTSGPSVAGLETTYSGGNGFSTSYNSQRWLNLYLSACKLLDLALALPPESLPQFQMSVQTNLGHIRLCMWLSWIRESWIDILHYKCTWHFVKMLLCGLWMRCMYLVIVPFKASVTCCEDENVMSDWVLPHYRYRWAFIPEASDDSGLEVRRQGTHQREFKPYVVRLVKLLRKRAKVSHPLSCLQYSRL